MLLKICRGLEVIAGSLIEVNVATVLPIRQHVHRVAALAKAVAEHGSLQGQRGGRSREARCRWCRRMATGGDERRCSRCFVG